MSLCVDVFSFLSNKSTQAWNASLDFEGGEHHLILCFLMFSISRAGKMTYSVKGMHDCTDMQGPLQPPWPAECQFPSGKKAVKYNTTQ